MNGTAFRVAATAALVWATLALGGTAATTAPFPPPAFFATIEGRVFLPSQSDDGPTAPGELVFLQRTDPPSGISEGRITGLDGEFEFDRVVPGGTYQLSVPLLADRVRCGFQMVLQPPVGPPTPLPTGLLVQPGSTSNVDLKAPGQCPGAPAEIFASLASLVPANVVAMGMTFHDDPLGALALNSVYTRSVSVATVHTDTPAGVEVAWGSDLVRREMRSPLEDLPTAVDVTLEHLSHPTKPTTTASATSLCSFGDDPLDTGERVRVSIDLDQPALEGFAPLTPTTFEVEIGPGQPLPMLEVQFVRVGTISGRAFVEVDAPNNEFDGTDVPIQGVEIGLYDAMRAPGVGPLHTASTDADGQYVFQDLVPAYYRVVVLSDPDRYTIRVVEGDTPPPADFAFSPDDSPRLACEEGDLHEVTIEAAIPVGVDEGPLDVAVLLWDGCLSSTILDASAGTFDVPFSGAVAGGAGVVTITALTIDDGTAVLRLRLLATDAAFPLGSFGPGERRLEFYVGGAAANFCAPLRCETMQPGTSIAETDVHGGGPSTLTALDAWGYDAWHLFHPRGDCVEQSADVGPGLYRVDVTFDVAASPGAPDLLFAEVTAGDQPFDWTYAEFDGLPFDGPVAGNDGRVTLLAVADAGGGVYRVRLRLEGGDRPDGNPATLAAVVHHVSVYLNDAAVLVDVDLTDAPEIGAGIGYAVTGFQNVLDAAACR